VAKPNRTQVNNAVLRQRLDELVERHGGVRAVGRVFGVTGAYISRLRSGEKIWPDDSLLKKMGLRRTVIYWRLDEPQLRDTQQHGAAPHE
jgi:hypothetical protein